MHVRRGMTSELPVKFLPSPLRLGYNIVEIANREQALVFTNRPLLRLELPTWQIVSLRSGNRSLSFVRNPHLPKHRSRGQPPTYISVKGIPTSNPRPLQRQITRKMGSDDENRGQRSRRSRHDNQDDDERPRRERHTADRESHRRRRSKDRSDNRDRDRDRGSDRPPRRERRRSRSRDRREPSRRSRSPDPTARKRSRSRGDRDRSDRDRHRRRRSPHDDKDRSSRDKDSRRRRHRDRDRSPASDSEDDSNSKSTKRKRLTAPTSPKPDPFRRTGPLPDQDASFAVSKGEEPEKPKEKPNLRTTGLLAAASNSVQQADGTSVALKYHEPAEARKPPPRDQWKLFVFKGADIVDTVDLNLRSCWLMGREAAVVDFAAEHPSISKQHAVIQFRHVEKRNEFGDRIGKVKPYLIDLESANGTVLNGDKVAESRYYELRDKDMIKLGHSTREYVLMLVPKD
ncbi:FHA domain-containing protein [Colletotrichum salicis]|uniref:FHA domain-containing protein n=1 Tax=Colletotrichum salicis TaxID=1209931 RepID=A0A135TLA5_9PEZI|nr:FHA domain-containing protein [Colletotrichum salicis]